MATQKFAVDWSDQPFPQIRKIEDMSDYATPVTLAEAKKEIIDHFQDLISHARTQIRMARALRVADVKSEERY